MKKIAIYLGCTLAVAGCSMASEEDRLENAIRENLSSRGNVQQVELTKQGNDAMSGFAVVRMPNGNEGRLNCSATRDASKGASYFNWRCVPAIDEAMVTQMEQTIRENLSSQATVLAVEMSRQDDDHMTGYAEVRDAGGNEGRINCTAARDADQAGNFSWECLPPEGGEAPAAEE